MNRYFKAIRVHVDDDELRDERENSVLSEDKALGVIIVRLAHKAGISPRECESAGRTRFGEMFDVSGRTFPRRFRPRKFSRSVLIERRMNGITEPAMKQK